MKMNKFETMVMTFDLGRQTYLRGIVRELRDLSRLSGGKKILEIGCGNGVGTQLIEELFKPASFTATEYDPELVEIAKEKVKDSGIVVEQADATNFRFSDHEFDAVLGLSVIHHISNWERSVDELHRVLKPGGLLIIKELSIETFETPFGRIARRFVEHPYDDMLKKNQFLEYIQQTGFEIVECQPHSMLHLLGDFYLVAKKREPEAAHVR